MTWSHSGSNMITADHTGTIKYWNPSMTNIHAFPAHPGHPIRSLSFSPRDTKFVSCSDDSTLKIWDWELYKVRTKFVCSLRCDSLPRAGSDCSWLCVLCLVLMMHHRRNVH